MKKSIAIIIVCVLLVAAILSFAGCKGADGGKVSDTSQSNDNLMSTLDNAMTDISNDVSDFFDDNNTDDGILDNNGDIIDNPTNDMTADSQIPDADGNTSVSNDIVS